MKGQGVSYMGAMFALKKPVPMQRSRRPMMKAPNEELVFTMTAGAEAAVRTTCPMVDTAIAI